MPTYEKGYTPKTWKNKPSTESPLNEYWLNHMEAGINEADNRTVLLSIEKLDRSEAQSMITGWSIDTSTWIVTVTHKDGTTETYDFPIEMMPTRLDLDADNNLVIVQQDGTIKKVNFERFVYSVGNTTSVAMKLTGEKITAEVVDGSITLDKLEPTVLTTIRQYMLDAQTAKGQAEQAAVTSGAWAVGGVAGFENNNAKHYSQQSKRYAIGGVENEDATDNAKYYCEQAQAAAEQAAGAAGFDGTASSVAAADPNQTGSTAVQGQLDVVTAHVKNKSNPHGTNAANVPAVDTSGLLGNKGTEVMSQALMDAIADKVATKLLLKSDVVSQIVNDATKAASMAALYAVDQKVDKVNSDLKFYDDTIEHAETVYSLFKNCVSFWGRFTHFAYHFRIGGNADPTFGNGHFAAYIMRDEAGAVYTALIINKWTGDAWTMIFTTYDDTQFVKKLS